MTQPAQQPTLSSSVLLKIFLAISFVAFLALAPSPALAQHGGGGGSSGGGGGSHGGGGGGSSHGGGTSSAGHASSTGHVSTGSHPTSAAAGGNPANPNGGGRWWNPFHGNNSNNSAPAKGGTTAGLNGAGSTTHFAANNYVWQDPPARTPQHSTGPSNYYANSIGPRTPTTTTSQARSTTADNRFRESGLSSQNRFHHNPNYYYYPYYPYYGFGFGSPFFGFGFGCDPWFGCPPGFGYGFGFGYGGGAYSGMYGYGGGSGYDGDLGYYNDNSNDSLQFNNTMPATADQGQGMTSPQDNASEWLDAPQNSSQVSNATPRPYVVIFLRDGSSYAVSDYWLAGGKLHYITSYGGENSVDLNQLDLQRTVNDNATRGVEFTLRPTPGANPPSDQQPPQPAPPSDRPQAAAPNPQ